MDTCQTEHDYCSKNITVYEEESENLIATPLKKPDRTYLYSPTKQKKSDKRKSRRICCVPECHTTGYDVMPGHGKPSYHSFPRVGDPLRSIWLSKIKRDEGVHFNITMNTVVCSLHFEMDTLEKSGFAGRTYLRQGAVPTIFDCWKEKIKFYKPVSKRKRNALQLKHVDTSIPSDCSKQGDTQNDVHSDILDTSTEVTECSNSTLNSNTPLIKSNDDTKNKVLVDHVNYLQVKSNSLVEENKKLKGTIEKLEEEKESNVFCIDNLKPAEVQFYTGFPSRVVFDAVLDLVNPGDKGENIIMYSQKDTTNEENIVRRNSKLSPSNQFLLFLCRVRVGLFELDLSKRFKVSIGTVSMIIISWSNFLYLRLGSINIWPSRQQVNATMPITFKEKYPNTRVIIDCTELKTEVSSSLLLKSQTYSNYKSSNTLKGLIGIAPSGSVTFISQLYFGNISDREITERSGFLNLNFDNGDSVMADKGFDIQDLLDRKGVKLNIPPFLEKYDQMTESDVRKTQSIAAERIHVERAINKIKNFHLFDQVIPMSLFGSINQIWTVCGLLTLFQDPIISCPGN